MAKANDNAGSAKRGDAAKKKSPKRKVNLAPASRRSTAEQVLRDVHKLIENRDFKNVEEMNAFLATLTGTGLQEAMKTLPAASPQEEAREEAQELAYEAMEAPTRARAVSLAKRALARDADCVDALVVLAAANARSIEDAIAGLEKAVAAGERSLGAEYFAENKGHFWGLLETRPYMRARYRLADMLLNAGQASEANGHFEALLELNPNDNQGIREILLGSYLAGSDLDGARRLLRAYKNDSSAVFAWGRTLEKVLSGELDDAAKLLQQARRNNRFVELYFTGQKKPPLEMPEMYGPGSDEEAQLCAETLSEALVRHPEVLMWLLTELLSSPKIAREPKKGRA